MQSNPEKHQLIPGEAYNIVLYDCCVQGHLMGTFLGWYDWVPHKGEGGKKDYETLEQISEPTKDNVTDAAAYFSFGHLSPGWGKWQVLGKKDPD